MSSILIGSIIEYVKNESSHERDLRAKMIKWFKIIIDKAIEPNISQFNSFIKEFREIREIYQKGKSFVKNQTKGSKKGFNSRKWDFIIKFYINNGKLDLARTEALQHLMWVKRNYSKRTYFRHKAQIKSFGLEID
ncbi:MAG: hypothetical protein KGD63_02015 [Candidatus Lokiarchaeota archaeon]|nr:hypothetical protein [Candidatus Lokiarchaeota archaeon]